MAPVLTHRFASETSSLRLGGLARAPGRCQLSRSFGDNLERDGRRRGHPLAVQRMPGQAVLLFAFGANCSGSAGHPADEALPRARRLQVEGWDAVTPTRRAGGPGESACVPWRTECAERKAACEKQNSSADRRCSELEPAPLPLKRPNARRRRCALWTMQEADRRALWPRGRTGHGRLAPGRPVAAGVPGATHVQTVPRTTGRPAGARTRQPQVQELSDIAERALSRPPRGPKPRGIARARRWAVRFW